MKHNNLLRDQYIMKESPCFLYISMSWYSGGEGVLMQGILHLQIGGLYSSARYFQEPLFRGGGALFRNSQYRCILQRKQPTGGMVAFSSTPPKI